MGDAIRAVRPLKVEASKKIQISDFKSSSEKKDSVQNEIGPISDLKESHKKIRESSEAKVKRTAQAMEDYIQSMKRDLKIQVHNKTGDVIVKVISGKDGHVIREIPPEEWLNLAAKMKNMAGVLLNKIV